MAAQVAPDASLSALLGRHCQASPGAAVAAALPAVLRAHWRDPQARAQAELDPAAAQRLACAGVAGAPTEADRAGWAIELASALVGRGEGAAAQAVLTAVRAETGAWADGGTTWLEGPWQFTQATIHYAASRHAAMRGAMDLALAAFEGGPLADTAWHAAALIGRADGWRRTKALDTAAAALDRAASLLRRLDLERSPLMEMLENQRGVVMFDSGDLEGSMAANRRELLLMSALGRGGDPGALYPLISLASSQTMLSQLDEADATLARAEAMIDVMPTERLDTDPGAAIGVLQMRSSIEIDRGRLERAVQAAERSMAVAEHHGGPNAVRLVQPLYRLGYARMMQGRYPEALRAFERAQNIIERHPGDVPVNTELNLAFGIESTLVKLGDGEAAALKREQLAARLATLRGVDYYRGRLARRQGQVAFERGDWAAVLASLPAAELMRPTLGPQHPYLLDLQGSACVAALRLNPLAADEPAACSELRAALVMTEQAGRSLRFGVFNALAQAEDLRGRREQARELHLQALAAAQSTASPVLTAPALDALATHLRAGNAAERALAVMLGKQAVAEIVRGRELLGSDGAAWDALYAVPRLPVLRRVAGWLADDGRLAESVQVLRALKDQEWFDFTRGGEGSTALVDWTVQELAWQSRRAALGAADAPPGQPIPAPPPSRQTAQERAATEARHSAWTIEESQRAQAWARWLTEAEAAATAAIAPAGGKVPQAPQASALAAARPRAGEAHLWYFAAEGRVHVVVALRAGVRHRVLDVGEAELSRRIGALLIDIARRGEVLPALQALHRDVLAPALALLPRSASQGPVERLVLRLDGVLRLLPFAALHDGQRWVGERMVVEQRLPGAAQPDAVLRRLEGLGATAAVDDLPSLPAVRDELCALVAGEVHGLSAASACALAGPRGPWPGQAWIDAAFDPARLTSVLADTAPQTALHLATHFRLRPGFLARSWLMLGDGQRWTLAQLAAQAMTPRPLVTLSACETAVGGSGAEREGLAGLFLRRGAARVVATLWPVDDRATAALMRSLYAQPALSRVDAAAALRAAQAAVRAQSSRAHPFYWAGFVALAGEDGRLVSAR